MPPHAPPRPERPLFPPVSARAVSALVLLVASACGNSGSCNSGSQNAAPASSSEPVATGPSGPIEPLLGPRVDQGPVSDAVPPGPVASAAKPEREIAGAAHILIAYKGAERASKTVTRSKDDAKKRAAEVLAKVKEGKSTFEELVAKYTDDEISKPANGALGNFERNAMPYAFAEATFNMKVGDISDVVETPQGFHIIKRTK